MTTGTQGVVVVNINSGNPRYPFPQFLDYVNPTATLANLARNNPVGVPHMEMEQRIRDAYQIFANEFEYTGASWGTGANTVYYIDPTFGCGQPQCTEGVGYAMLAAAWMGDKTTFDGLWFFMHDVKMQLEPTFAGNVIANPTYPYGNLPIDSISGDSAADGDYDISMAMLMAWYQWGDLQGLTNSVGAPISYKAEALALMKALADVAPGTTGNPCRAYSGDIGFDGYFLQGNSVGDITQWSVAQGLCPQTASGQSTQYSDYSPPAYFHEWAAALQSAPFSASATPFEISQHQRAEASADWLIGQLYANGQFPFVSQYAVNGTTPTFTGGNAAETFRQGWRTILNYVWHGDPTSTWDPTTHSVQAGVGNQFEYNEATLVAPLLKNPESFGQPCSQVSAGSSPIQYQGTQTLVNSYTAAGAPNGTFALNWVDGGLAPAAVAAGDPATMNKMFRQCVIQWDQTGNTVAGDYYHSSIPVYFHGWFRLLGMLVLTGNLQPPSSLAEPDTAAVIPANMKIYKSVNRTFAFPGDQLTYWLNYRNYASVAATAVSITDNLPAGLSYVSSNPAGVATGSSVVFNIGPVAGLQNQNYAATMGGVTVVASVNAGTVGQILCNTASITCANGTGWTSNEYPDDPNGVFDGYAPTAYTDAIMQRNCVDIVPAALSLTKSASPTLVNPTNTITYTLAYQNSQVPFLNGGRPGVDISFANAGISASSGALGIGMKIWHDADAAYINYGNYRISYYLNQPAYPAGSWNVAQSYYLPASSAPITVTQENLTPGTNWNQRLIIQCGSQMAEITPNLYHYSGTPMNIHQGGLAQLATDWNINATGYPNINWTGDWSADPLAVDATMGAADGFYPVSPDWTNDTSPAASVPVTQLFPAPDECPSSITALHQVTNILVEEWDGYTWRRAFGTGPVSGRPMTNVTIVDTLPTGVTFGGWVGTPTGTQSGNVLTWTFPKLEVNQSGTVSYWVTANAVACPVNVLLTNQASIQATNEDPVTAAVGVSLTCNPLPTPVPAFLKSAQPASVNVGGNLTYNLAYTVPNPVTTVTDAFTAPVSGVASWGSWALAGGVANSWSIAGGVLQDNNWAVTAMQDTQTLALNTTVTATIQVPQSQWGGVIVRAGGGSYYEALASPNSGSLGNIEFEKVVGGVTTLIASTGGNQPLPAGFFQLRIIAQGNTFLVEYNTGTGWVSPLGTITDSSISTPGYGGIMVQPSGVEFQDFTADLDRMALSIEDTVPAATTYISSAGSSSQPAVGGTGLVTWVLGTAFSGTLESVTLVVQVASCPAGGFVYNQALLTGPQLLSNMVSTTVTCGTPSDTPTVSRTPSSSPTATATPSPSATATPSSSATPSASPTLTLTGTPSASRTASPSATVSGTGTGTPSPTMAATATATPSPSPSFSPSPTLSNSASPSGTATPSPSATPPFSVTSTPTATPTLTASPVFTPTLTGTATQTFTASPTRSASPTASASVTASATPSATPTSSSSATLTPTRTWTATSTASSSATATPSLTPTATQSLTRTGTGTASATPTRTASLSPSPSVTVTPTVSLTHTRTPSFTVTPTFSASPTWFQAVYQQPVLLQQKAAYPNPFSDTAHLYFQLRVAAEVTVDVYNVAGEVIYTRQVPCQAGPNVVTWQGVSNYGGRCATGIYIVAVKAGGVDGSQGSYWTSLACTR